MSRKPVPEFFQRLDRAVEVLGSARHPGGRAHLPTPTTRRSVRSQRAHRRRGRRSTCATSWRDWPRTPTRGGRCATSSTSSSGRLSGGTAPVRCWPRSTRTITRGRSTDNWIELYGQQPAVGDARVRSRTARPTTDFGRANLLPRRTASRSCSMRSSTRATSPTGGVISAPTSWCTSSGVTDGGRLLRVYGESFVTAAGSSAMVEGGPLRAQSPAQLQRFLRARVLEELVGPGLDPIDKWDDPAHVAGNAAPAVRAVPQRARAPESWEFRLPIGVPGERARGKATCSRSTSSTPGT